jgi:hypothetical protein
MIDLRNGFNRTNINNHINKTNLRQITMKNLRNTLFGLFCLISFSAQATVLPKTAKLVPPETVLLAETDNFAQLQSQFEKTSFYQLYKDSSMAAFIANAKETIGKENAKLDDNNILKVFYNAGLLPKGKAAIALVLDERTKDANEPPMLIITQWGDRIEKVKEVVKKLVQKNIDMGGRQKPVEDYRGVSIETLIDEQQVPLSYCFIDDCLLASPDMEILKFAVAHLKGSESSSLADSSDYTSGYSATGPNHDLDIFINLKQFIKITADEDPSGEAKKYLGSLGLDNVKSLSLSIGLGRLSAGGTSAKALLKIDGDKKGICKILDVRTASYQLPSFIPSMAYNLGVFNLDIKTAFDELVKMVTSISPGAASIFYTPLITASQEGGPSVELKKDIIDYLGSQIVSAEWPIPSAPKLALESEGLSAISITNRTNLEKSLSLVHGKFTQNKAEAKRELLGHTIYLLDLTSILGGVLASGLQHTIQTNPESEMPMLPKMAFTLTDTHLIIGTESAVEKIIRNIASSSAASINSEKWFSTLKSSVPSSVGLAGFENYPAVWEKLWEIFRKGSAAQKDEALRSTIEQPVVPIPTNLPFDFSLLPSFDTVRKYVGIASFYGISRPDGFFFEVQYINQNP